MERSLKISSLGYASRLKICDASVSGSDFAVNGSFFPRNRLQIGPPLG